MITEKNSGSSPLESKIEQIQQRELFMDFVAQRRYWEDDGRRILPQVPVSWLKQKRRQRLKGGNHPADSQELSREDKVQVREEIHWPFASRLFRKSRENYRI